MKTKIAIQDVCERDLDLMFMEEAVASTKFRALLLSAVGAPTELELVEANRSVVTDNGESDLELTFEGLGLHLRILIENKVDAALQPNQAQRYRDRAAWYEAQQVCDKAVTMIVAPNAYFGENRSAFDFDAHLSYEEVLAWLQQEPTLGTRVLYKEGLLKSAIDRGRRGWQLRPDAPAAAFWVDYFAFAQRIAPELRMPFPKREIPSQSHFIRFRPLGLPPGVDLYHKFAYGHVDLQFAAMGHDMPTFERKYGKHRTHLMLSEEAGKSAVIRMLVEPIPIGATLAEVESTVANALASAKTLVRWYEDLPVDNG